MAFIELAGDRVWAHTQGSGDDILLIAGLGDDHQSWAPQLQELSERFRVTVFDNRGTGRSSTPPEPWSVGDFARDALAVLDGLGIIRAHVLGSSLGAAAAQELAAAAPGRVRSLILNGTWLRADERFRRLIDSWIAAAHQAGSLDELLSVINLSVYPPSMQGNGLIQRWLDEAQPPAGVRYATIRDGFVAAARAALAYDAGDRLRRVAAPALLTVGSDDEVLGEVHARAVAAAIPRAAVTVFPGCGHHPFQEQPHAFNELVTTFFAGAGTRERAVA